ncbi:MAG: hypothetical protein AAFN93_02425, partial [Bacteroidota bacterium]
NAIVTGSKSRMETVKTAAEGIDELTVTDANSNVVATVAGADIADPSNFTWEYTIPDTATVDGDIVLSHNVTDNAGQMTTTAAVFTVSILDFDPVTIAFTDFENDMDTAFSEASNQTITFSVTKDALVSFDELAIATEVNDESPIVTTVDVSTETGSEIDYTLNVAQAFLDEVGLTFFISDEFGNNSENIGFNYDVLTTTGATFLIEDVMVNGNSVRQVRGNITDDVTFAAADTYYLSGGVEVSDDATLTVEQGSTVYAETDNSTQLTIDDSGALSADGTAANPIVFTSGGELEGATQEPGDWSGIRIEGEEGHNSGVLNYVRIEFGGDDDAALRLNLVDVSTTIDFVQVFRSSDIGLEARAGNVNLSHIFISEAGGVSIDLDDDDGVGYEGNLQYVIVQTSTINEKGGRDFEARDDANFTVSNMTMLGSGRDAMPAEGLNAMRMRDDVGGFRFFNTIIAEYSGDGPRVDNHTAINGIDGDFVLAHSFIFQIGDQLTRDDQEPSQSLVFQTDNSFVNTLSQMSTPGVAIGIGVAAFVPNAEITSAFDPSTLGAFFEAASFVGAIGSTDWTTGWSVNANGSIR